MTSGRQNTFQRQHYLCYTMSLTLCNFAASLQSLHLLRHLRASFSNAVIRIRSSHAVSNWFIRCPHNPFFYPRCHCRDLVTASLCFSPTNCQLNTAREPNKRGAQKRSGCKNDACEVRFDWDAALPVCNECNDLLGSPA